MRIAISESCRENLPLLREEVKERKGRAGDGTT